MGLGRFGKIWQKLRLEVETKAKEQSRWLSIVESQDAANAVLADHVRGRTLTEGIRPSSFSCSSDERIPEKDRCPHFPWLLVRVAAAIEKRKKMYHGAAARYRTPLPGTGRRHRRG